MKMCCQTCLVEWHSPFDTRCWSCGRQGETGFLRNLPPIDGGGWRSTRLSETLPERERPFVKGDDIIEAQVSE